MPCQTEKPTRELATADLDHVVAAGAPSVSEIVVTKDQDTASPSHAGGGGGGAGKVSFQDLHFVTK